MKPIAFTVFLFFLTGMAYAQSVNNSTEHKNTLQEQIIKFEGPAPVFISLNKGNRSERISFENAEPKFIQTKTINNSPAERVIFNGPEIKVAGLIRNVNTK